MFGDDASIGDTAAGIHGSIGKTNGRNRPGDVFRLQTLLHKLGYRDAAGTDGPTGYLGSFDHEPIMAFQRDHGLKPDGMLEPGGETIRALQNFAQQPDIAGGPASEVVQVRAYQQTRDGKTVQVSAHERGGPGGGATAPTPKAAGKPGSSRDNPVRKTWSDKALPDMQSPVSNPTIRSDSNADGGVKATRRDTIKNADGSSAPRYREHAGLDIDVKPGETISSPVEGTFVTNVDPYEGIPGRKDKMNGMRIRTENGDQVTIYYMEPGKDIKKGDKITKGQAIGKAQNVQDIHGKSMDPHIHMQVTDKNGAFKDPTSTIGAKRRPSGKPPAR